MFICNDRLFINIIKTNRDNKAYIYSTTSPSGAVLPIFLLINL